MRWLIALGAGSLGWMFGTMSEAARWQTLQPKWYGELQGCLDSLRDCHAQADSFDSVSWWLMGLGIGILIGWFAQRWRSAP